MSRLMNSQLQAGQSGTSRLVFYIPGSKLSAGNRADAMFWMATVRKARGDTVKMEKRKVRRGDIYHADLDPVFGSEQGGYRPVLVIQNNIGNQYSPTVIVAAITK